MLLPFPEVTFYFKANPVPMRSALISLVSLFFLASCGPKHPSSNGFVEAGQLKIYCEQTGEGPSVLLVHAGLQDHLMWQSQVDALKDDFQVTVIDLPGHGQSTGNDTLILIADVLAAVLDQLKIEKTSVIGLSYGSSSTADLMLAYPERVEKIVLVSPGLTGWEEVLKFDTVSGRYFAMLDSAFAKKDDKKTAEIFTKAWCDGPFREPAEVNTDVRNYILKTTYDNLTKHDDDTWGNFSKNTAAERLGMVKQNVLIIYGDKDIPSIRPVSEYYHRSIPGSHLVEIKNVAHMLNMEEPEQFNKIIRDFLTEQN
jgi:3-oxoadipate enol-lactonase